MKFKRRMSETTLDILVEEIEVRITRGGLRLARIYAVGLDSIIIQMWGDISRDDDEKFQKLIDVPRGTVITITGRPEERAIYGKLQRFFTVDTWTDNKTAGEPPDNITEVPF